MMMISDYPNRDSLSIHSFIHLFIHPSYLNWIDWLHWPKKKMDWQQDLHESKIWMNFLSICLFFFLSYSKMINKQNKTLNASTLRFSVVINEMRKKNSQNFQFDSDRHTFFTISPSLVAVRHWFAFRIDQIVHFFYYLLLNITILHHHQQFTDLADNK